MTDKWMPQFYVVYKDWFYWKSETKNTIDINDSSFHISGLKLCLELASKIGACVMKISHSKPYELTPVTEEDIEKLCTVKDYFFDGKPGMKVRF